MFNSKKIVHLSFFILILLSLVGCRGNDDYQQLCLIYKGIVDQKIDLSTKEGMITEKISQIYPDFFNKNFIYIMEADSDKRYGYIKKIVEEETKQHWECKTIKRYYMTQF